MLLIAGEGNSGMAEDKELQIQSEINNLLLRESHDKERFAEKLKSLVEKFGEGFYPSLLFTTVHLEFSKRTAQNHWQEIFRHWDWLSQQVQREIDIRVAILDYFIDINKRMKNPKIIEIKIFQRTQQETIIDELTQLYNYRYFIKALNHEIIRANRYHAPLTLAIFDVDDFKHYNDTNGHLTGSKALVKLAKIIKKNLRDVDIVARYGGEEFTLLLPETNKDGGLAIAERIRQQVEQGTFINGEKQPLKRFTISGGITTLNIDAKTGPDLIEKADQALYRAKKLGKNQIFLYLKERRSFERLNSSIKNLLVVASERGDNYIPQNISEGGILFHSEQALPLGKNLHLSLNFRDRKTTIPLKAKIRRVEQLHKNKKYEIGASIIQIQETEKRAIKKFLNTLTQK